MQAAAASKHESHVTQRYAKCIAASKRVRWEIEQDVIRGRKFDFTRKFLPDGLSCVNDLAFLSPAEMRFLSQVQGRTYVNIFGLVERYIGAKTLEVSKDHWLGDQVAMEALVRLTDEELKHQEMFRRLDEIMAPGMPPGYKFMLDPNEVAKAVLGKCTWAVLGLTLDIEIFSQVHYRASIERDEDLCPLWKDVFLFHWKEEAQHAILDELEWRREDAKLNPMERDVGVDELIGLVGAIDGMLQVQSKADTQYFAATAGRSFTPKEMDTIADTLLKAYRWQYIVSGVQQKRFTDVLGELVAPAQMERIGTALGPLLGHVGKMALPIAA
jgi:hypothetical protein